LNNRSEKKTIHVQGPPCVVVEGEVSTPPLQERRTSSTSILAWLCLITRGERDEVGGASRPKGRRVAESGGARAPPRAHRPRRGLASHACMHRHAGPVGPSEEMRQGKRAPHTCIACPDCRRSLLCWRAQKDKCSPRKRSVRSGSGSERRRGSNGTRSFVADADGPPIRLLLAPSRSGSRPTRTYWANYW
jgi:hypothetical protein